MYLRPFAQVALYGVQLIPSTSVYRVDPVSMTNMLSIIVSCDSYDVVLSPALREERRTTYTNSSLAAVQAARLKGQLKLPSCGSEERSGSDYEQTEIRDGESQEEAER